MSERFIEPEELPSFCDLMKTEEPSEEEEACAPVEVKHGQGIAGPPSPNVERIDTVAPMPYLRKGKPANAFRALKDACKLGAGFDFLAVCGDVMREKGFQSSKPGVASKSRHKCGQAFDYNQADKHLIVVSEPKQGLQFFRTWLKCEKQDGSQGTKVVLRDIRGFSVNVFAWDFTKAAEDCGLERIPAWSGWQSSYTKKEFWHYQLTEGTTYEQAMAYLYSDINVPVVLPLKVGSKGDKVKTLQQNLYKLGFLASVKDIDGNFGPRTEIAVKAFQQVNGLKSDGIAGLYTQNKINQLIEEKNKMGLEYNTDEVNTKVGEEADVNVEPKPFYATSQFAVLLATYILGPLAMWLAAKGVIASDQVPALVGIFQTAIVAGMAFVTREYLSGRNEVSAIKARAAAVRSLSAGGPTALAAFQSLDRS